MQMIKQQGKMAHCQMIASPEKLKMMSCGLTTYSRKLNA